MWYRPGQNLDRSLDYDFWGDIFLRRLRRPKVCRCQPAARQTEKEKKGTPTPARETCLRSIVRTTRIEGYGCVGVVNEIKLMIIYKMSEKLDYLDNQAFLSKI